MESHDSEFAQPVTRKAVRARNHATDSEYMAAPEKTTTIKAHIVRSIAVTMSEAEMNVLCTVLNRALGDIHDTEFTVVSEFLSEVHNV